VPFDPEKIAQVAGLITESPDVMSEAYCSACGGWDKAQGGTGHR
jgi:hypothetical protein